ncbi:FAD-binding oxidoreductase [Brytella acorum]|uniref:FAD-binding protein n=1 Tax=Brytella acorum TaxID=2959299 RepID=A0AA35UI12_9PROT|nr:FAD-binding protein [Brytella acorum]CAI9121797.1 FAD-binding protein [Brytella acorum]
MSVPHIRERLQNPFYLRDQPNLTQASGWIDAWQAAPSAYVCRARHAWDVREAILFAAKHRIRLVVRGAGHSFVGGSCAPDSLLIWTRDMNGIELHDRFVPQGSRTMPEPAVSLGAGCIWLEAYQAVTNKGGRYVQGGSATTVGVAGLIQGGGFGSFSKGFGTAGCHLLEAEIVTADGVVRVVNKDREPDLFWALKGGGGGTFGVVTRLTLRTHPLPETFGIVHWKLKASSSAAFKRILERFVAFYAENLFNPHWGEQAIAGPDDVLELVLLFHGLDSTAVRLIWQILVDFVADRPEDYIALNEFVIETMPARRYWDEDYRRALSPYAVVGDYREDGNHDKKWWWRMDGPLAGAFWHGCQSCWLPQSLLKAEHQNTFVDAWFAASRFWPVSLHFNKGLAGTTHKVRAASQETPMNQDAIDAFALAIIGYAGPTAYFGLSDGEKNEARVHRSLIDRALKTLRQAAPATGCYMSECDYNQTDWQQSFWGPHHAALSDIKHRYDPDGLFTIHHGVAAGM